jgi:hypothetical protein
MATTRGRVVQANQVVLDQVDFFQPDGFTRVTGLTPGSLVSQIFYNNAIQPWPLISGLGITDAQVVSGRVYFNEVPGLPGFYNVRFRPNALGFWRNLLTYTAGQQISGQDYDVVQGAPAMESGITASFIKPQGSGDCC